MSDGTDPLNGLDHVEAAVTAVVEKVFDSLETIAATMQALWVRLERKPTGPDSGDLATLRDVIISELQRQGQIFNGAGVVVADGILADCPRYLEWWRPNLERSGPAQRLQLDLNPQSDNYYDYSSMEWFTMPRDHGIRWVHGPYLDYTGVDLYVCTFAVPITSARGEFLGIAGADVPVAGLDAVLLPTFTAGPTVVALTNAEGRVIVANHADHVTGSKIGGNATSLSRPVPKTPWLLVRLSVVR